MGVESVKPEIQAACYETKSQLLESIITILMQASVTQLQEIKSFVRVYIS